MPVAAHTATLSAKSGPYSSFSITMMWLSRKDFPVPAQSIALVASTAWLAKYGQRDT